MWFPIARHRSDSTELRNCLECLRGGCARVAANWCQPESEPIRLGVLLYLKVLFDSEVLNTVVVSSRDSCREELS